MSLSKDLPNEIFLHIGVYLNRRQLINSSLVCKSWNAAFESQVWSYIEIGANKPISQLTAEDICNKASWIRSLVVRDCESTIRFSTLGKKCTRLQSLAITATLDKESLERNYWDACKDLVKQNRRTLVSLSLTSMSLPVSKPRWGGCNWSPLLSIAQYPHSNLKSLRLENCELPYRHLTTFWDICEQLEVLELHNVPFELPRLQRIQRTATVPEERQLRPNLGSKHQRRVVRFSNLLELTLNASGPKNSLTQLEEIIRRAPKLKTLDWIIHKHSWFPITRFMYLFSGQDGYHCAPTPENARRCVPLALCTAPCWPGLVSLRMNYYNRQLYFLPSEFQVILDLSKGLRVLDLPLCRTTSTIMDSLLRLHSTTLTELDWRMIYGHQSSGWVQRVLSSCPRLIKGCFRYLQGQDVINGGDSWVCCKTLEDLRVDIKIGPRFYNIPASHMTDQEEQDMSFAVFKQLARLRKLKILDLDSSSSPPTSLLFTTSMGLQMLYSLADLEVLRLPGKQDLTLQDVDWMFKSWESLKTVNAERLAASRSQITTEVNLWDCALATKLNKHGINTPGSVYSDEDRSKCLELGILFLQ